MSSNAAETTTPIHSDARRASIANSSSATPPTLGSQRVIPTGDPNHQRTLSFSEIHEELEQEQEAQVNRMMQTIRNQQLQLEQVRGQYESGPRQNSQPISTTAKSQDSDESANCHINQSHIMSEQAGSCLLTPRTSGPTTPGSPARSTPIYLKRASRCESSRFMDDRISCYEAEAAQLARENQVLLTRVRNLEKQIANMQPAIPGNGHRHLNAEIPGIPSPLLEAMHKR